MTLRDPMARLAAELSPEAGCDRLSLYVALGDSFTAGTGCAEGESWPERLTASLRRESPSLALRNLAVEGATSSDVLAQLGEAVELEPDLITVVCGANDVLRFTRPDSERYEGHLAAIFRRLREVQPGVRMVTATSPERWDFMKMGPRTRARVERGIAAFNRVTRRTAAAHDVACLDLGASAALSRPENFSPDGLHPSPLGHQYAARGFARLLRERFGLQSESEAERARREGEEE